jgi:DNA-binding IclR family transcriptional regulator
MSLAFKQDQSTDVSAPPNEEFESGMINARSDEDAFTGDATPPPNEAGDHLGGDGGAGSLGGVQSLRRAAALLRALAKSPTSGSRLKDLTDTLGFERATIHRLLRTMIEEGLVEQDISSKRYHLGLDFFALASAASNRYDVQEVAHAAVIRLADALGDCVFFSLRSGFDAICIDAHTGVYPVKTLPFDIGGRHPLGATATGIAFLAPLPDEEVKEVLRQNAGRLARYAGYTADALNLGIQRFREIGFAFDDGRYANGVHSIAVPLADRRGRPLSVLTVAATPERMPVHRRATVAAAIQAEGSQVVNAMWRKADITRHRQTWIPATKVPLNRA